MRRLRRTYVRSFGHGLMLASLPVLAFLGVDYLVAPPSGTVAGHDGGRSAGITDKIAEGSRGADASADVWPPGITPSPTETVSRVTTGALPGRSANLAASIQSELRRVGCYAGDADGVWNERTRVAMRAFNTSVHVNLGTDKPDYILLTLLQGHSSKACSRTCDAASVSGGTCIDKSIEARALPPTTLATRNVTEQVRGEARVSSVSVPTPILLPKTITPVRPADPSAGTALPVNRWVSEVKPAAPAVAVAPSTTSAEIRAVDAAVPQASLPGRMAVGALPAPEARPGSGSASEITEARPVDRQRVAPAVVSRSRPDRVATPERKSRLSRTFTELNRNSP